MSPEQWDSVRELFHAALDLPPRQRQAFLDEECPDPVIRAEVESLLDSASGTRGVMDDPAVAGVREALQMALADVPARPGQTIGHYEILSAIGSGGMGEVYRARDLRLKRQVALKILGRSFASNPESMVRFRREAEVLASLNHPNIAQIYGVEDRALVMELVEGDNLKGPLPLTTALTYARQIAEALEYAHEKGVVHRDLKPANIKVTPQGLVKVLDFGLAKVVDRPAPTGDPTESPTVTLTATHSGMIMGTAAYMSPEQAAGRPVDKRSDVWSFGVVLWEILTGARLFQGESVAHTLADVLRAEIDFNKLPMDTPQPIRQMMMRCLDRDPKTRLRDLGEARILFQRYLADPKATGSGEIMRPSAASSQRRAAPGNRAKLWLAAGLVTVAGAIAAIGYFLYTNRSRPVAGPEHWKQITTYSGGVSNPVLSADGRMLAFVRDQQLYVKILPDGPPLQLTHDALHKMSPAFSPDNSRIAYTVLDSLDTWVVPVLAGGEPQLFAQNAQTLTWIDSQRILFDEGGVSEVSLETAMPNRAGEREIYRSDPGVVVPVSAISPDKKEVLVAEASLDAGYSFPCRLLPFDGGSRGHEVGPGRCSGAVWTPDSKWMYFAGETRGTSRGSQIWRQRTAGGQPEQVTFGPTEQQDLAMAPDGKSLYTVGGSTHSGVWIHDAKGDHQISIEGSSSRPVFDSGAMRLYYWVSRAGEGDTLWATDLTTGASSVVFPGVQMSSGSMTGDGKSLVYTIPDKSWWIAALDRQTPPRKLPIQQPIVAVGGSGRIYFRELAKANSSLYSAQPDGGDRRKVINDSYHVVSISPDEKWISVSSALAFLGASGIRAAPVDGGAPKAICEGCTFRWSNGGKTALFTFRPVNGMPGISIAVPLPAGQMLPPLLPAGGFNDPDEVAKLPGSITIPYEDVDVGPGLSYAYTKVDDTRNIFQIPLE